MDLVMKEMKNTDNLFSRWETEEIDQEQLQFEEDLTEA